MTKRLILLCATLLVSVSAVASQENKELMLQFLSELTALKKYMVSETAFNATANETEIAQHLKEFSSLAKLARHSPELNAPNFQFSRQILEDHIVDTENIFRKGNKTYARWQLNATVSVCASCHSQLPANAKNFGEFKDLKIFSSDFDKAEFLFAIRNFDEALPLYRSLVSRFPGNQIFTTTVESAIQRELTYYLRVKRDPKAALPVLREHAQNPNLWPALRAELALWSKQLESLSERPVVDFSSMSKGAFARFFRNNPVEGQDVVTQLYYSGLLLEFININRNTSLLPDALYQLALAERSIGRNFFFSLADMYLKACLLQFPQAPVASKCYATYEDETVLSYTGSSGTRIPDDVKEELDFLKKLVKNKGKIKIKKE